MVDQGRRNFLKGAGALGAAAVAGCTDMLEPDNGYEETPTQTPEPVYELNFSLSDSTIDLSDLPTDSLDGMDEGALEHFRLEDIELYRDGEEYTDIDSLELHLENEQGQEKEVELGPELDNAYELACTEILNGENTATLKARKNGETIAENTTNIEKIVPETYRAQIIVDGENFDDYQTPFSFDNIEFTEQEYQKLRQQHINNDTTDEIVEKTVRNDEVDFHPEFDPVDLNYLYSHDEDEWQTPHFENLDIGDLEDILNDTGIAYAMHFSHENGGRSGISGRMNRKAATTITLIDQHINNIPEGENRYEHSREINLEGGHISTGGHGNALYYERNTETWINYDPDGGVVSTPAEAPDAKMKDDRFYAPTDYELGHPDNHEINWTVSRKKREGLRALLTTNLIGISSRALDADDHWIQQNVEKIGNNQPIPQETETMLQAAQTVWKKTGKIPLIYGGDTGENRLLITENGRTFERFRENPEPVTTQEVEQEMLG